MDDAVAQFMAFTNQNATVAAGCLSMTEGDVMAAVNMFFENPDIANSFSQQAPANAASSSSSAAGASAPPAAQRQQSSSRPAGRGDPSGVITIDSDDDDVDFDDGGSGDAGDHDRESIERIQRIAQENDDEAMARRMQEEMYGQGAMDTDGVRAPIARTTETLVAPSGYAAADEDDYGGLSGFMAPRARAAQLRGNPFGQSIWEDDNQPPGPPSFAAAAGGSAGGGERAQRLADLFRPPYQLMSPLSWDDAREEGKASKRWILVNVQDMSDFNCQALNRDIWKDDAITSLVQENFVFLQYSKDDPRATEYNTFYFPHHAQENRDNFPHVAIIDPRTGEQVKVWSGIPFPPAHEFLSQLVEFLDRYSLARNSKNPVSRQKAPQRAAVDVDRMTEEEMLEMAMRNSLATNGSGASAAAVNVHDPDALTKSLELDKDKGKGVAAGGGGAEDGAVAGVPPLAEKEVKEEEVGAAEDSVFASIAADRPHVEPEQSPGVTRIQFRHANGRVIRRFALSDPVRRIYEWLKAEPLGGSGGAGGVFELKVMPQGKDLLEDLDRTVEEAGLKQATVMVEHIEP